MISIRRFVITANEPTKQDGWLRPTGTGAYSLLIYTNGTWKSISSIASVSIDNVYDSEGKSLSNILAEASDKVQGQISSLEENKQNTLIPGTNIEILSDGTINCTVDTSLMIYVDVLPTKDIQTGKIYCVKDDASTEEHNVWDEYYWNTDTDDWELIGKYVPNVDLSEYLKISDAKDTYATITTVNNLSSNITSLSEALTALTTRVTTVENTLAEKQDKLTAGENITIDDNVISCTIDNNPFVFCEELPTTDIKEGKIYCIPDPDSGEEDNVWIEYYWKDDKWELMGKYEPVVDLTPYLKKEEAEATYETKEEAESALAKKADKDEIPTVPTNVSAFNNDAGYITDKALEPYDLKEDRVALIESTEDDTYVEKVVDAEGNLLMGFKENGEIDVPIGLTDDAYDLIKALAEKMGVVIPALQEWAESSFATPSDVEKKQDKLTAGENITIDDNVISASVPQNIEDLAAYGIRRNINDSSPTCTRIGNLNLHKACPIQNQMRGCLLDDDGNVVEYLPEDSWEDAVLDGSKGQVMVEIPKHYRKGKLYEDGTMEVWISLYKLAGYEEVPLMYVSAYEATVQRSTNKLSSVMSDDPDYRGGNNSSSRDDTYQSQIGTPATNITSINFLNYARNRGTAGLNGCGWNSYLYEAHKAITWLFVIEYATLNSQADYNEELTSEGYHQGGLGAGVTNLSSNRWYNYMNNYYPFIKCGSTNMFGNRTGVLAHTMAFEYDASPSSATGLSTLYVGEYDEEMEYVVDNYVSEGELLYRCIADAPAGTPLSDTTYFSSVTRTVTNIIRYHGIEDPFGLISKWACDILVMAHPADDDGVATNSVYVCKDPSKFSGTSVDDYTYIGETAGNASGGAWKYFLNILFGKDCDTIGEDEGGSTSTYYCDGWYVNNNVEVDTLRGVRFGGSAHSGSTAGLFCASSNNAPSSSYTNYGSRLCFLPASTDSDTNTNENP